MSEISKQALKVDNNTSFPNNTTGYISPTILRAFNVNMIDSLVEQAGYTANSASWNVSIGALNTYTASFAPSLSSLNAFTASQLTINSGVNAFTQSANGRLNNLEAYTASFTTSVGIYDEGTFVNNVNQINFVGNGITASFVSGKAVVGVNFTPLNDFTASTSTQLTSLQNNFNSFTQSTNEKFDAIKIITGSLATTGSNSFVGNQWITGSLNVSNGVTVGGNMDVAGKITAREIVTIFETASVIYSSGSNQLGDALTDTQILSGSTYVEGQFYVNKLNVTDQFALINTYTASQNLLNTTFATTGSNTFIGTQIITGSLLISGSSTNDFTVVGQIFVSSSATGGTTAPRIAVSGSQGQSLINRNSISTRNLTNTAQLLPSTILTGNLSTFDEIGFTVDPTVVGVTGWSQGIAMYVNNTPGDTYPAVFGFQNKANYTDGRVTVLTPLIVNNGLQVTGSTAISGAIEIKGNVNQLTGSITAFGNVRTTNGTFTSSVNGGLEIDGIGYVGSGSAGAFFVGTTTQDLKIQNWYSSSVDGKNIVIENYSPTGSATPIFGKVALRARGVGGAVTVENTSQFRVECSTQITGSLRLSGSVYQNVISQSIVSSTASIDLSVANFYRVALPATTTTNLNITNPGVGQTAMIQITSNTQASASFSSNVKQPSGFAYVPSSGSGDIDVLTLACFDGTNVLVTNVTKLV